MPVMITGFRKPPAFRLVLTNEEVNEAAAKGGAFRPVSGARGESAADVFMRQEEDGTLLGVFNYSLSEERHMDISVEKLGFRRKNAIW